MEQVSHPLFFNEASRPGTNCLSFAAAAVLLTRRHQVSPSTGPALIAGRSDGGINDSTACNRAVEHRVSSASRAKVGDASAACISETAWCLLFIGLVDSKATRGTSMALDYHGRMACKKSRDTPHRSQADRRGTFALVDSDGYCCGSVSLGVPEGGQGGLAVGRGARQAVHQRRV